MIRKLLTTGFYLLMLTINYLSVSGQLGGLPIRALSDKYDNLFTPAPFTFSIWSVIYLLLLICLVLQFRKSVQQDQRWDLLFILSCSLNAGWVVVWQYEWIGLSVVLMLALLITLAQLNKRLQGKAPELLKLTFGIYLGWICIATIANITTLLVAWQLQPDLLIQQYITTALLPVALIVLSGIMYKLKNPFPALAAAWAFYGIYAKRADDHPVIAWAALGALATILITAIFIYRRDNRRTPSPLS